MTRRRDFLTGIAAIAAGAGITGVAVPAQRPDTVLAGLIAEWLPAREAHLEAIAAHGAAEARAKARYPAKVESWLSWREKNHPNGKHPIVPIVENPSPQMRALHAEMLKFPLDEAGKRHLPTEFMMKIADAIVAEENEYYAEIEPAYDQLLAQRRAAIAAIDAEEHVAALAEARFAAWDRANVAHEAVLFYEPASPAEFMIKAVTLLQSPFGGHDTTATAARSTASLPMPNG